ncbi:MAG: hypothetical protein ACI8P3_004609 [Saprospiraceae bacterium]|jgi:hypothetical protein
MIEVYSGFGPFDSFSAPMLRDRLLITVCFILVLSTLTDLTGLFI